MRQPQNQQKTNYQSHQKYSSIFGRLGYFKRPSFVNAWFEDACAVWLHSSAILGSAGLGEAFGRHGWIVFCGALHLPTSFSFYVDFLPTSFSLYVDFLYLCMYGTYVFGPW